MSNAEDLLQSIIDGETVTFDPMSRTEAYLKAICNNSGTENLPAPQSRIDALLLRLAESGIGAKITKGSFVTPTTVAQPQIEDAQIYEAGEVKHNLGVIPSVVYVYGDDTSASTSIAIAVNQCFGEVEQEDETLPARARYNAKFECTALVSASGTAYKATAVTSESGIKANRETFVLPADATRKYQANKTYHWIAIDLGLTKEVI